MAIDVEAPGQVAPRMTGIVWGPPKVGKTTFLMSAPGTKLIINVDPDGYQSVAGREDFLLLNIAQEEPGVVIRYCRDNLTGQIKKLITEEKLKAGDTVVFDSLTSFAHNCLLDAVSRSIGESRTFKPSIETPGLAAYGARTQNTLVTMQKLLKATAQAGLHCFFTAHLAEPERNKEGEYLYETIALSDNTINGSTLAISEIWYMDEATKKRTLAIRACRGKKPMGTRLFVTDKEPEFTLKYDPTKGNDQPHSIETWFNAWVKGGKQKLPLPQ